MRHSIAAIPRTTARFVPPILLLLGLALLAAPALGSGFAPGNRLLASTLLGASAHEEVTDMVVGPAGTVYVVGWTESADFPVTPGAFDTSLGGERDAFVAELSADLTTLLAATYLGGSTGAGGGVSTWDAAYGIALAPDGLWLTGYTYTDDFPVTAGAFDVDNVHGGSTVFVAKLGLDLDRVDFATYLGESDTDLGFAIALDPTGGVFVTGLTVGSHFPTTEGAYDRVGGPFEDVFVSHLSADLSTLLASTLVRNGYAMELALGPSGAVYISGETASPDFPVTPGGYDTRCGRDGFCDPEAFGIIHPDVFLSRLDHDLTTLEASTYLGDDRDDTPSALELDGVGGLYVSGSTSSRAFPTTPGAFQTQSNGFKTIFVSRLDVDLTTLDASTLLGGFEPLSVSEGFDMALDDGGVYVTGETISHDFPTTPDAFDRQLDGGSDAIVSVLDRGLGTLIFSSLLGGDAGPWPEEDRGASVALAGDGTLFLGGATISPNFPTSPGSFQPDPAGEFDGFVTRVAVGPAVSLAVEPVDPPIVIPPEGGELAYGVTITNRSGEARTVDFWREVVFPDGSSRVIGPQRVTVPPGTSISRKLSQEIPGRAPAGTYSLVGHLGLYPVSRASDGFRFEKRAGGPPPPVPE